MRIQIAIRWNQNALSFTSYLLLRQDVALRSVLVQASRFFIHLLLLLLLLGLQMHLLTPSLAVGDETVALLRGLLAHWLSLHFLDCLLLQLLLARRDVQLIGLGYSNWSPIKALV